MADYKINEGLKRAIWRTTMIGVITAFLFFINNYAALIPASFSWAVPLISAFIEKLERNYRENK